MIDGQSVIGVIPARAGSKRVPEKNRRFYRGKWLLAWSIEAARKSRYLDTFYVSSDAPEILTQAAQLGANVLERPAWLADDKAMNEGVLIHTLYTVKWAEWIVLLQPTSPLRTAEDIDNAIRRAQLGNGCVTYNEYGTKNGAVYVCRSTFLVARASFHRDLDYITYTMPNERSLDIDYEQDFGC